MILKTHICVLCIRNICVNILQKQFKIGFMNVSIIMTHDIMCKINSNQNAHYP